MSSLNLSVTIRTRTISVKQPGRPSVCSKPVSSKSHHEYNKKKKIEGALFIYFFFLFLKKKVLLSATWSLTWLRRKLVSPACAAFPNAAVLQPRERSPTRMPTHTFSGPSVMSRSLGEVLLIGSRIWAGACSPLFTQTITSANKVIIITP